MPIQRAKMELLILVPPGSAQQNEIEKVLKEHDLNFQSKTDGEKNDDDKLLLLRYSILVDPSLYRILNDVISDESNTTDNDNNNNSSMARIEIINQVVTKQGDINLEAEIGQKQGFQLTQHDEDDDDDDDHDVIDQSSQSLQQIRIHDNNDSHDVDESSDDDDDDDVETSMMSRRKAQKEAKKRNQKSRRRTDDTDDSHNEASTSSTKVQSSSNTTTAANSTPVANTEDNSGRKSCNTCGGFFDSAADYRAHFRSDWHRFNQKLKMKGAAPISEKEFLLCDSDTFFTGKCDDILL
jgi:ribosome maturation protein SDO1